MSFLFRFLPALCLWASAAASANYDQQDEFHVRFNSKETSAFVLLNEIPDAAKKVIVTVRDHAFKEFSISLCPKEVKAIASPYNLVRIVSEMEVVMPTSTLMFGREYTTQPKKNLHVKLCDGSGVLRKIVTKNLL